MQELTELSFKQLRETFYEERARKNFKKKYKDMFSLRMPDLIRGITIYQEPFNRREEVIMEGDLLLGAVLMANELLFENTNNYDCAAVFIYSHDNYFEENPNELVRLAHELFAIRTLPEEVLLEDIDKKEIADMLNAERTPIFNYVLPRELTHGKTVFMTTLVVIREEIKNRVLNNSLYPILVKDEVPSAMLLDYKCYDSEVKKQEKNRIYKKTIMIAIIVLISICSKIYFDLNIKLTMGLMLFLSEIVWAKK